MEERSEHQKAYGKAYREAHRERYRELARIYALTHKRYRKEYGREYYAKNNERKKEQVREWAASNKEKIAAKTRRWKKTETGREVKRRSECKRRRSLGFVALNKPFGGSVGHHTDQKRIIYIPEKLHRSVWHSVIQDRYMGKINTLAFNWLETEQLYADFVC